MEERKRFSRDNREKDFRSKDGQGRDNRGSDNRGTGNRGADNRGASNRGRDERGADNRGADNRGASNRGADERGDRTAWNRNSKPTRNSRPAQGSNPDQDSRPAQSGNRYLQGDRPTQGDRPMRNSRPMMDNTSGEPAQPFLDDLDKLEGRNSVLEALKSGRSINRIFVAKGDREGSVNQIIAMARQNHILIQEIDRPKLDAMSQTFAHQGVIALTAAKDYVDVDDILKAAADSGKPPFIIILDEITDAHNLGSVLRTANAAGVHGIIIPKRRAIGLTATVSKASAGAIEYVPVARVTNTVQTIEYLKKQNIWVVGTDSTGEQPYFDRDLTGAIALVIGSEGEGMGKLVRESCDFVVNIPMMGQITSLNAAVAGAVVTFEILRQRSKKQ